MEEMGRDCWLFRDPFKKKIAISPLDCKAVLESVKASRL